MVAIIALLLWLLPIGAHATTYYVATTGSNSNNGTSESTPYLTIQKCVDMMVAGDTCYVRSGTYSASGVRFRVSGSSGSPIQLLNYPNELPVLSCSAQTGEANSFLLMNGTSYSQPIGWLVLKGFEVTGCYNGIKAYNLHDTIVQNMNVHDNLSAGMLVVGGQRQLITQNIFHHNGSVTTPNHNLYLSGNDYTITRNVIYASYNFGLQQNGSQAYTVGLHAGPEYAGAQRWIVSDNTFAYSTNKAALVVWGGACDNSRYENNIFYENGTAVSTGSTNGIDCVSCGSSSGISIKNNHFYASGSGAQADITSGFVGATTSGNVTNVSAPAFVNGGTNSLPASPDFRLTASAPVNIALANEFTNNSTLVVGAYKTIGTPTATITTNKITISLPMSTATPVQNLSTAGVTVGCTGSACPGSPTVSTVSRAVNTDAQVEVTIAGITGNACEAANQTWTVSYTTASGTWTGNDNIGPYPGSHQTIFSFSSLAVTNNCTGSGPTTYPAGYHLYYKFDEGTGTSANDESANNLDGTLTNGPTWGTGKTGYGVVLTGNNTEHVAVPYGNGVNPSTQSLTIAFGIKIPAGTESLGRQFIGAPVGVDQRLYVSALSGTWQLGIQASPNGTAGNIAVTSGWHHVCLTMNSGTDTATLYIDGVASTAAGAVKTYTSYALSGDFDLGRIADTATGGGGGTYDDLLIYQSVEDCAAISSVFHADPPAAAGTLAQAAIQFQGVILDTAGSPIVIGSAVQSIEVPAGGGVVLLFQVHCQNVANCDPTAFKLVYAKNGSGVWQQVPDVETADGTWMWGVTTAANLNNGTRSTRLTGSCAVTAGATQITSAQTPSVDLPQDGCTILAYIVREGTTQAGNYFDYKLRTAADADFTTYTQTARVRVVNPMGSGIGF